MKYGEQTVLLNKPAIITSTASIVGPKEGEGPLAPTFDKIVNDPMIGKDSWETAESEFVRLGLEMAIKKAGITVGDVDYIVAGDLLNQSTGSTYGVRELGRPYFGIYGACSTMGEGLSIASLIIDSGNAEYIAMSASSHFCAAERQFRFPLEFGNQRPLTSTWTVTGAGAAVLTSKRDTGVGVMGFTTGKIIDMGITDANNMGAAMAPAAVDTIAAHFRELNRQPSYYDVIATGDLGYVGKELLLYLLQKEGYDISEQYTDCGIEIFDRDTQDTHSGGSGCACSAVTFAGHFYSKLKNKEIKRMLLVPTGALMSTMTSQQGETIPGIAHAVIIENV